MRQSLTTLEAAATAGRHQGTAAHHRKGETALVRLEEIEWDFASARTGYLTHNLHPYPAKFIPQIPNALIQELSSAGEVVADIFCGSGTTLLEALCLKRHAFGIDANPLATLVSRAKTTPLTGSEFEELAVHQNACKSVLADVEEAAGDLFHDGTPFRSPGWRPAQEVCAFWFEPHVIEELASLRLLISHVPGEAARRLCSVAFAAIIVPVSKQDSDTRYVRRRKVIKPGGTVRRYLRQLDASISAVRTISASIDERLSCQVIDANLLDAPETEPFDLVVTSPPYPNAYSYHLYHRTRLIWLGYNSEHFKRVEIGSHRKYSAKGKNKATPKTFREEFEKVFFWLRDRLRDRCYACFVIGDSTIDGQRIDNATLLSAAGKTAGFREISRIGRVISPTRKTFNPKIGKIKKESILILRKV